MTGGPKVGTAICRWLALLAVTGCGGMLPLARNSGAVISDEGVVLAVTGQNCRVSSDSKPRGKPVMDASFAVEVGSSTLDGVTVYPARFLLIVADRRGVPASPWEVPESILVETGTTFRFALRFVAPGVHCSQEMRLAANGALEVRGRPVNLEAVRFVPGG
jgi:hypothetical protein